MSTQPCGRCAGCGKIDNGNGEPWTAWERLPPGSDLAVRMGLVKPVPCPDCGGTGLGPADLSKPPPGPPNPPKPDEWNEVA